LRVIESSRDIVDEIIGMFNPNRHANQGWRYSDLAAKLSR
jgi:hypothetical protein